jgi:hypothetical protein
MEDVERWNDVYATKGLENVSGSGLTSNARSLSWKPQMSAGSVAGLLIALLVVYRFVQKHRPAPGKR